MRILIISYFNDWVVHLGIELEIAQTHLDAGDEVVILGCDGSITACRANPLGEKSICEKCRYRRLRGISKLSKPIEYFRISDFINPSLEDEALKLSSEITSAESAKSFYYKGQDLGWGALSSTIQETRDPLCKSETAKEYLSRLTNSAILSYEGVRAFLTKHTGFSKAYIYNGRFSCSKGAFRACQEHPGLEAILHERGSTIHKYALFENDLLHAKSMWERKIEESWESEPDISRKHELASLFYTERRQGTEVGWKSFTAAQKSGLLPENWDQRKTNIVIFNSSEDEFAAIGDEWKNHIYPMQSVGIKTIVDDALTRFPDYRFYLRIHPNLQGVENEDMTRIRSIISPNFQIIETDSNISTYSLIDAADKIVSFGSSVGIEATFWDKPSIMAGHSFYEHLGSVYCPKNHEEVLSLIGTKLKALPKEGAIKYGYHLRTFGSDHKYWKANGFYGGSFKDVDLSSPVGMFYKFFLPFGNWMHTPARHLFLMDKFLLSAEKISRRVYRKLRKLLLNK